MENMENMKDYLPTSDEVEGIIGEIKDKFEECVVVIKNKSDVAEGCAVGIKCSPLFLAQALANIIKENPVAYELAKVIMKIKEKQNGNEQ